MPEFKPDELISVKDLAKRLGIEKYHMQRAIIQDIFPYAQSTSDNSRYVLASDTPTLGLLERAAEIFKAGDINVSFADAVRLAKRGYVRPDERQYA